MKLILLLLFCSLACISCKKYDTFGNEIKTFDELQKANWLVGEWQNLSDTTNLVEIWNRENDSTLTAVSYFIQNKKDTLHSETIELVEDNKLLRYSSTIVGQNNNEDVLYQKTTETESEIIFENPQNNYPQKIVYQKLSPNQLKIIISGKINGKSQKDMYKFTKK